ncbi:fungal-specific transcription factor domain-containing protein [Ampelomyces quisqualis]|uniref:Fungal-specific transcription factor domain-containing protein n=1 Tax=Ampelomyces quisqualis TaxID=50730 RepID=A0A6A5QEK6_AMPQU|nr:fungal-specific transcription factor domain-containing protein [Ampelomyces quisqualis]
MPSRRDKTDASAPRKRALVSCDRCKLRRARCIRDNADEPCADCQLSGVQCESKLPRKQRVYGSVETLSLRYRALEALVKGLFPYENTKDTNVVFALAAARDISMPASDDYTPADIFPNKDQRPLPIPLAHAPRPGQSTALAQQQSLPSPQAGQHSLRSTSSSSLGSTSKTSQHNPFSEVQPISQQASELIPTRHGVPHYFGPSSSFRLANTICGLSARCKSIQNMHVSKGPHSDSRYHGPSIREPTLRRPTSTNPSDEEYTISDPMESQSLGTGKQARPKSESAGATRNHWGHPDGNTNESSIADLLPSRSLADALVSAYFDNVHMYLPLFHRSIFQYQLGATYSRQSELLKECRDVGWLICLAMVFAFGCEQLQEHDPEQANALKRKYLEFAKIYFRKLLTSTSLVNVQALMMLHLHHHTLGQKSTSWLLVGLGARMAITMGMHRDGSNRGFDPIERNTRRQVWWSIYVLEKMLCSVLGRPTVIDDNEMTMRLPDMTMLEQQNMSAEFMDLTFQIAQMSYKIRQRAYFDARTAEERSPTLDVAVTLLKECDAYHSTIPPELLLDSMTRRSPSHRPKILLLHLYFYYTRCTITRDFLVQKVERDLCYLENRLPPISENWDTTFALSEDCVYSAHQSLRCIMAGLDLGLIGYSWLDLFFVFHSVLIICADFLARPRAQQDSPKDVERKDIVCAILNHVRGMKRLGPTYSTLSRIAMQFAVFTSVYNEPPAAGSESAPSQTYETSPESGSASTHGSVTSNLVEPPDFEEDWFASATTNLGLDFFDLNRVTTEGATQSTDTTYPAYMQPMVTQTDDWTDRTLRGVHNI